MQRILIDLPDQVLLALKQMAEESNISRKSFIENMIIKQVNPDFVFKGSKRLTWKEEAKIKYAQSKSSAVDLAKEYGVSVDRIRRIFSLRRNPADKEFERATGKTVDTHIDDFLKWRDEEFGKVR